MTTHSTLAGQVKRDLCIDPAATVYLDGRYVIVEWSGQKPELVGVVEIATGNPDDAARLHAFLIEGRSDRLAVKPETARLAARIADEMKNPEALRRNLEDITEEVNLHWPDGHPLMPADIAEILMRIARSTFDPVTADHAHRSIVCALGRWET